MPKAIKLDQDGVPVSSKEQAVVNVEKRVDVETIAWAKWLPTLAMAQKITNAKHLAACSVCVMNHNMTEYPVAIVRKGPNISPRPRTLSKL